MNLNLIIFGIFLLVIAFEALSDANRYNIEVKKARFKGWLWHLYKSLMILGYLISIGLSHEMYWRKILVLIIGYTLVRVGIFDLIYNVATKKAHPMQYIGETALIDRILSRIFKKGTIRSIVAYLRFICLFGGFYVLKEIL
jgi:hypothetical protein